MEARSLSSGQVACGGAFRDKTGGGLIGFSKDVDICSVMEDELSGVYADLKVACNHGANRLILEMDNMDA
ncbi:hypothetical protein GQ457_01G018120 [Hibiscus cannabinus]